MKKFLLMMVAAFMVALGASAQFKAALSTTKMKRTSFPVTLEMNKAEKMQVAPAAHRKTTKRAPKLSEVEGTYILNADNYAGDLTESSEFTIEMASGTITLDMMAAEGQEAPTFDYNVILKDFTGSGINVYGLYDAEEGSLFIPVQKVANAKDDLGATEDLGDVVFSALVMADGKPVDYGYSMLLWVNDDGTVEVDPGDFEEEIAAEQLPEGSAIAGFYNALTKDTTPWNFGLNIAILVPNATLSYYTNSAYLGGTGNGWTAATKRVAVEDYDTEWLVSNFLGMTTISVTLNEDGTCYMPLGSNVCDYNLPDPYGMFRLVGISDAGDGYISRNYEKTQLNGFYADRFAAFYTVDGEGNVVQTVDDYFPYAAVATAEDEQGQCYSLGYVFALSLEIDEVVDPSGISDVKSNAKNSVAKTFNLMGQEVSKSAKGLVIRDGKKYVNK